MWPLAAIPPVLAVWVCVAITIAGTVSIARTFLVARIARWNAIDRGRVLLTLAVSPVLLPTIVVMLVLTPGLLGLVSPAFDHCTHHPNHAHICVVHPTVSLPPIVASLALLSFGAGVIAALVLGWRTRRRSSLLRELLASGTKRLNRLVHLVEVERPVALTFGLLRPQTLVSSGLLQRLRPEEVDAVLEHEAEHARRYDPLRQLVARLCSIPLLPVARRALLFELALAAEEACDERAARHTGDRLAVAQTILEVERLFGGLDLEGDVLTTGIGSSSVATRVETLLGEPMPLRSSWPLVYVAIPIVMVLAIRPLHHGIEHVLAWVLGTH